MQKRIISPCNKTKNWLQLKNKTFHAPSKIVTVLNKDNKKVIKCSNKNYLEKESFPFHSMLLKNWLHKVFNAVYKTFNNQ